MDETCCIIVYMTKAGLQWERLSHLKQLNLFNLFQHNQMKTWIIRGRRTGSAHGICGVFELFLSNYILKIPTKSVYFTQFQLKNISNEGQIPYFHIQKHTTSDNAQKAINMELHLNLVSKSASNAQFIVQTLILCAL